MKNATLREGLEPTTFVTLFSAHHAIHLRHGGLGALQKVDWILLASCYLNTSSLLKGCGFSPGAANFFVFECLIWE